MQRLGHSLRHSIEVEFDGFKLSWRVLETPSALLWIKLLLQAVKKETVFFPRFTGFISPYKTREGICRKLNRAIEIINGAELDYKIEERAEGTFTQEFANRIHHHFELLEGSIDNPTQYWRKASPQARIAIANINYCIHDLEALSRAEAGREAQKTSALALVLEGLQIQRFRLPRELYGDFSLNNDYGDIVLHYAQIGKTHWEVFLDRDESILNSAILPLDFITGEFDVFFQEVKVSTQERQEFESFLRARGLDPADPALRLGYISVAKFEKPEGWSESHCNDMIAQSALHAIHILEGDRNIASLNLDSHVYDLD